MVICDTNVFYDISSGVITKDSIKGLSLCALITAPIEFTKSYKLLAKMHEIRGAVIALKENCERIILEDPFDYALSKLVPDYKTNPQKWMHAVDGMNLILEIELKNEGENFQKAKDIIIDYEQPMVDQIDELNQKLAQRPKIKKSVADGISALDLTEYSKKEIATLLEHHHLLNNPGNPIKIDLNSKGWEDLDFFVNVWIEFHKDFIRKQGMKMDVNDVTDLYNTVYVGKGDTFFTMENYWIKLIKGNPITAKYLHLLSGMRVA
jgi:hypothetical protein